MTKEEAATLASIAEAALNRLDDVLDEVEAIQSLVARIYGTLKDEETSGEAD